MGRESPHEIMENVDRKTAGKVRKVYELDQRRRLEKLKKVRGGKSVLVASLHRDRKLGNHPFVRRACRKGEGGGFCQTTDKKSGSQIEQSPRKKTGGPMGSYKSEKKRKTKMGAFNERGPSKN